MRSKFVRRMSALVIIILILMLPVLMWIIGKERELQIAILDNTVPDKSYREHKGLTWMLNHYKYVKSDGTAYSAAEDYFGFKPGPDQTYTVTRLSPSLEYYDLLYVADTYGVYTEEYYGDNYEGKRSEKIYGGLESADLQKIESAVNKGIPLIAEFNAFASPTTASVRESISTILGLTWSGWIARYFEDLSEGIEVPVWAVSNYEKSGKKWNFTGPGFLFVNEEDEVIVLERGADAISEGVTFTFTEEGKALTGIKPKGRRYNYWFDIVEPRANVAIIAEYKLALTEDGLKKLKERGIPTQFPAVLRHDASGYSSYYFAGDYADNGEISGFYQFYGLDWMNRILNMDSEDGSRKFYWNVYMPLMKGILREIYEAKTEK